MLLSVRAIVDGRDCYTALNISVKTKANQVKVPALYWLTNTIKTLY